jgi:glycosyltransferase involved in cell wall biosynthesis
VVSRVKRPGSAPAGPAVHSRGSIARWAFSLGRWLDAAGYRALAKLYGTRAHAGGRPEAIHFFVGSLDLGGAQRQLAVLIRRLSREGYRCKVWLQSSEDFFAPDVEAAGARWETVSPGSESIGRRRVVHRLARLLQTRSHVWMALALSRRLRTERPAVLQCLLDTTNVAGALAGRMAGVPVVVAGLRSLHPADRGASVPAFQNNCYRLLRAELVDAVVANSESGRVSLLAREPSFPARKVHVIHNGLEAPPAGLRTADALRQSLGIDQLLPVVLWAGRLAAEKRPEVFVRACAALAGTGRRFVALLAGDGGHLAAVQALVAELGVTAQVHLLGKRRDVADLIRLSRVTVLTSDAEGLPNILLEAALCGCPIVATRAGGVGEIVEDAVTGFLVDIGDHEAISARIARLIDDPTLAVSMGQKGRLRARRLFDPDTMAAATLRLYQNLAAVRGTPLRPRRGSDLDS